MENILFCDIDKTLTKPSADEFNLSEEDFQATILDIKPNLDLINEIKTIVKQNSFSLVFNTGRSEVVRAETLVWLKRYFEAPVVLLMRPVAVGLEPEQVYNSKVRSVEKYLRNKNYDNLLFVDDNKEQLKKYIMQYPMSGAYAVEDGKLNRGFYPINLHKEPTEDEDTNDIEKELMYKEREIPQVERDVVLSPITDETFDD